MLNLRRHLTAIIAALFFALPTAYAQKLTLQDLVSTEPIGETSLSPDGSTFALARNGQIYLMPANGGWPEPLTTNVGGKAGLAWSPDGKKIAYASQGSIWVVPVTGGAPKRLTNAAAGSGDPRSAADAAPRWSPKGRWILFTSGRRGSDLMAVSEDGDVTTFLTPAGRQTGAAAWSPDGSKIAYVEITPEHFSGSIHLLDFDTRSGLPAGPPRVLYTAPLDRGGGWRIGEVAWSPDGSELATVLQNSGWDHIYLLPVSGGVPKQITDGAFADEQPQFSADGKSIAFTSSRGGVLEATNVWVMPATGGAAHLVSKFDGPGFAAMPEWAPDGQRLFFHRQTPRETSDLFVSSVDGSGSPIQLTNTTPKVFTQAVMPERVTWKSKDGREIEGMLYLPPGEHAKNSLPLLEWVHGGPEGQDGYRGDAWAQYLAGAGYVVLEPNYRGSNGYGEVFRNLNVEDSGGGEVDDVAYGAKYLVARGIVDPKRMAIGGISHGATMTIYMIARYPDLYAAAIEFAGVADRALFNERTNLPSAIRWQMKMGGSAAEKPENYRKANILLQVDKVQTPLLALHGEDDPQVPPANSAELVKALREHHKTVYYFTYPKELHWVSTPADKIDSWQKELAFLEHYINPKIGIGSTSTEEVAFPKSSVVTGPAK